MIYIITSTKFDGELQFEFNSEGQLVRMELLATLSPAQHQYILGRIPADVAALMGWQTEFNRIKEVPPDLSFDTFWAAYDHKVGSKVVAERRWKALAVGDKMKALEYLRIYDSQLVVQGVAKKYPETYLSKKEWIK